MYMRKSRHLWLLSLLAIFMLVLAACAGDGQPKDGSGEGGGHLIITVGADVVSLSTHGSNDVPSSNVQENIYETLTVLDENQQIQPGLAESWDEVDDTTWEFHLREGVKFHDGEDFNEIGRASCRERGERGEVV